VQELVAETLGRKETSKPTHLLLLDVMKRASLKQFPEAWFNVLEAELKQGDMDSRMAALSIVQERGIKRFDPLLKEIALDKNETNSLRVAVIGALAPRLSPVDEKLFEVVGRSLKSETTPLARLNAARVLASLQLSDDQLYVVAGLLGEAEPLVLPPLLRAFTHSTNNGVGASMIVALGKNPAAASLSPDEIGRIIKGYPSAIQTVAKNFLSKVGATLDAQEAHLQELSPLIEGGDLSRGKAVFFGRKAGCATCHRISGQGGLVGPGLSQIGKIRTGRDLLESIAYPSASIVQGFRPFNIETTDDQSYSGLIIRQMPEAIWIRGADLAEVKIETSRIKNMQESSVSIMPAGLADSLTKDELRDLLAYLESQK
jgi:putative heme-binding domain-containing protein